MSAAKRAPTHLPWKRRGATIYFANVAGGFYLHNCPDPEALAAFIVEACNNHDTLTTSLASERMHKGALISRVAELEADVKKWASECGECNGTGVVQPFCDASAGGISHAYPGRDEPCPDCEDIRAYLKVQP